MRGTRISQKFSVEFLMRERKICMSGCYESGKGLEKLTGLGLEMEGTFHYSIFGFLLF